MSSYIPYIGKFSKGKTKGKTVELYSSKHDTVRLLQAKVHHSNGALSTEELQPRTSEKQQHCRRHKHSANDPAVHI